MKPREQEVGRAYDELAASYDDYHVDAKSLAENAFVADRLKERVGPRDRVIDVGCGTGLLLDLLDLPPERYLGLDISEGMLERARAKYPEHRFLHRDASRPELLGELGSFDLVVSLFGSPSYCALEPFAKSVARLAEGGGRYFLMYCGPQYVERSTYINRAAKLLHAHDTRALRAAYRPRRVWGMSWLVDHVPSGLPVPLMKLLLRVDAHTIGRVDPDRCFFVMVEG